MLFFYEYSLFLEVCKQSPWKLFNLLKIIQSLQQKSLVWFKLNYLKRLRKYACFLSVDI